MTRAANGASPLRYSRLEPASFQADVFKRGKLTKTRKRRHLALGDNFLTLRRKFPGPVIWSVDARRCTVTLGKDDDQTFEVESEGSLFAFEALSGDERKTWHDELTAASKSIFDFYDVGKIIGRGSFAEVSLAADKGTQELFAVKCITRKNGNERQIESLRREMEIITSVNHPNVVSTVDIFHSPSHIYLVMEHMAGGELFDIIAEASTFEEKASTTPAYPGRAFQKTDASCKNAMEVMREILLGLAYLHGQGIVHRDIKPENVLCVQKSWPLGIKLCDFGLSNVFESDKMLTSLVGTCVYRAPEMVRNKGHGSEVDLWAAGVILYVMLFGLFPFFGQTDAELNAEIEQGLQYPNDCNTVTDECRLVLEGLLTVDPKYRLTATEALGMAWFSQSFGRERQLSAQFNQQRRSIHSARRSDLSSVLNSPRDRDTLSIKGRTQS